MSTAYQAARQRSGWIDRSARGRLVVSGADRATYLQGLLTNDTIALTRGAGCYAAYLTPHGRMISDLFVYELGDVMLLSLPSFQTKDTVLAKLDQFIFSEDVRLGDVSEEFWQIAIVGPESARVVSDALAAEEERLRGLAENGNLRATFAGGTAIVTRITDAGEPGFDVYVERAHADRLKATLEAMLVAEIDAATADVLRVEGGIPLFHRDMDEETIPLEAGIETRAINMNKGCYVGQEVIVRVLHRGHGRVAKKLAGLTTGGQAVPEHGATVTSGDRDVGTITSAVLSPALGRAIALAYLHRDFLEVGTRVAIGSVDAAVTALPFVPRQ